MKRKNIPTDTETAVLRKSRRRCALCFHLDGDTHEKQGQIAHLDHDPSNCSESNIAFLCMPHHSVYDSKTSQHKNYTLDEVKAWRDQLYEYWEINNTNQPSDIQGLKGETEDIILRKRDIRDLELALSNIHWPTVDEHIRELPRVVIGRIFHFFEGFNAVVTSSLFRINDPDLASEIREFHRYWIETVSFGRHYRDMPNGNYLFDTPKHRPSAMKSRETGSTYRSPQYSFEKQETCCSVVYIPITSK